MSDPERDRRRPLRQPGERGGSSGAPAGPGQPGERSGSSGAPAGLRLFVGVRVSIATVNALDEAVQEMRRASPDDRRLRWVAPASYHVTLKFLGWTRPEVGFALRDALGAALAGQRAFELETRGLGGFPALERARVLWAGVDPAGAARLTALAERVERAAEALGFAREQRPYHPHVTLARLAGPSDVRGLVSRYTEQLFRSSWVDGVVLFETKVKSDGSEYQEKARWPLETDSKASRRHTGPVDHGDPVDDPALDEPPGGAPEGPGGDAERPNDDREE